MGKVLKRINEKSFEKNALGIMEKLANEILQMEGVAFISNVEPEGFEYAAGDKQHFVFYIDGKIIDEESSFNYGRYDDEGLLINPPDLEEYLEIRHTRKVGIGS